MAIDTEMIATESSSDSDDDSYDIPGTRSPEAVEGIEGIIISFLAQLASAGCISNVQSDRGSSLKLFSEDSRDPPLGNGKVELRLRDRSRQGEGYQEASHRLLRYPRKNPKGSLRSFAQLFRLLDLSHEAIVHDVPTTKRDVYYKDVPLFCNQRVIDTLVDDLAATLELERSDLKIRASPKGLICGSALSIHLTSGETIQLQDTEGTIIPVGEDISTFSLDGLDGGVEWVLIVEKEAVFQTLCRLKATDHYAIPGRGLIITGKGFPDLATRHLVATFADMLPSSIPILALVDADPYGLEILSVYKFGSRSLQHENETLSAPRIRWLGLKMSELDNLGIDKNRLIPITKHDEKRALCMLRDRPNLPLKWRRELMRLLHTRRKAEIEVLTYESVAGGNEIVPSKPMASHLPSSNNVGPASSPGDLSTHADNAEQMGGQVTGCVDHSLIGYLARGIGEYVQRARARTGKEENRGV